MEKPSFEKDSELVALIADQARRYDDYLRRAILRLDEVMVLSFAIVSGAAAVILERHYWVLGFATPFVFQTALVLGLNNFGEVLALAAHKDILERQLAVIYSSETILDTDSGTKLMFVPWERIAGRIRSGALASHMLVLIFTAITFVGGALSLGLAWDHCHDPLAVRVGVAAAVGVFDIMCVIATIETYMTFDKVEEELLKELRSGPNISWSKDPRRSLSRRLFRRKKL